ncbi:hypothetical protein SNE40_006220 [Patella caerulea]|uniref:C2H2-type domain-containing protein n=1 Tax=Patella caerulea TaxID=87958 RepID=A0AAN8K2V6_PATCE
MALDFNIKMEYMDSEMMPDADNFSLEETANALQTVYVCRSAKQLDELLFSPLLINDVKMEPTTDVNMWQEHYIIQMEQVNDYSQEEFQEPFDWEMTPEQLEAAFNIQPPLHARNFKKQTKTKTSWLKNRARQKKVKSSKKSKNILHKPNKSVIKKAQPNKTFGKTIKIKHVPKNETWQWKVNSSTKDSRDCSSKNIHRKPYKSDIKKAQQKKTFGKTINKKHVPKTETRQRNSKNIHHKPNKSVVKKAQQNKTCGKTIKKTHSVTKTAKEMTLTSKKYQCELCNVIFPQKKMLDKHKNLHKEIKKTFPCKVCKESFSDIISLLKHSQIHSNKKNCNGRSESFNDTASLKANRKTHIGEKPFKCDVCNKSFFNVTRLKFHSRSHMPKKVLKCDFCRKSFKNLMNFKYHLPSHKKKDKNLQSDPPKPASIDDKTHVKVDEASTSSTLLKPMTETTPKNSTICVICNRSFKSCQSLKFHMRSHKNHRLNPVSIEDKADDKSTVGILKPHTGRKILSKTPFKCDICDKSFKTKMALRFHSKTHQSINKNIENNDVHKASEINTMPNVPNTFECHGKSFKNKMALKSHSKTHIILSKLLERDPLKADINGDDSDDHEVGAMDTQDEEDTCAKFVDTDGEADDKSATPSKETNVCDICGRSFKSYQVLNFHMRSHSLKPVSIEGKADDIVYDEPASSKIQNSKIKTSPSKKSFDYGNCSKSFKSSQNLKIQTRSNKIINKHWETEQPPHLDSIEEKADDKSTVVIVKPQLGRKTPSKTPFKCDVCNRSLKTKMALACHSKTHKTFNKNIENDTVDRATTSSHKMLKPVIETTPSKNSIVCGVCSQSFKTCQVLNFHMRSHKNHSQKPASIEDKADDKLVGGILKPHSGRKTPSKTPFKCDVCKKSFKNKMALRFHSRTHKILNKSLEHEPLKAAGKETIPSEILHKLGISEDQANDTDRDVDEGMDIGDAAEEDKEDTSDNADEEQNECAVCFRPFDCHKSLQVHMKIHSCNNPLTSESSDFMCEICGMNLSTNDSLVKHLRRHTGEKLFVCDICGAAFSDKFALTKHSVTHSREKNHCEICDRGLGLAAHLI